MATENEVNISNDEQSEHLMHGRPARSILLSKGMRIRLVSTGFMVIVQFVIGLIMAFSQRTTLEFLGIFTCCVSIVSLFGWVLKRLGFVFTHLVYSIGFVLATLVWSILYWNDFVQKCSLNMDLYDRYSPETLGLDCATIAWQSFFLLLLLLIESMICISSGMLFSYLRKKAQSSLAISQTIQQDQEEPLVTQNVKTIELGSGRIAFSYKLVATSLSVVVVIITLILASPVIRVDYRTGGVGCPNDPHDFLPYPMRNELDCCNFHNPTTCCRRKNVCNEKTYWEKKENITLAKDPKEKQACDDVLGLLSCAPCRPDSCTFTDNIGGVDRMCTNFCDDVFNACKTATLFGGEQTIVDVYGNNSVSFCETTFHTKVIPKPQHQVTCQNNTLGCYSPASSHGPSLVVLVVLALCPLFLFF